MFKVIIFLFLFSNAKVYANSPCEKVFTKLDTFAQSMTEGLSLRRGQELLFKPYRKIYFGDPKTDVGGHDLADVIKVLEKYPELSKQAFREQYLVFENKNHEAPQSLIEFVKRFKNSAVRVRNPLFYIHANLGVWRRMLGFSKLNKREQRDLNKKQNEDFQKYLNTFIDKKVLTFLQNPKKDPIEKTVFLYKILNAIRKDMLANNKDVRVISQSMLDLVHTSGFGNEYTKSLLNSKNPKEQLEAVRKILDQRDSTAIALGFEGHFAELQRFLEVEYPTGSTKNENFSKILRSLEKDVENRPYTLGQETVLRVRPLSLQEAPFRSCLGGSDCSSQSYFFKALDPNFHYFTITDKSHKSSGHITVVLGTAEDPKGRSVKAAFVDKIQNVPNDMLLPMLESLRLSLKEQGYKLALPKKVGGENGLSNEDVTRNYVQSEINSELKTVFRKFKPHENKYSFENGYSRAYSKLDVLEFELVKDIDVRIEAGEIKQAKTAPKYLSVKNLYEEILSLQHSKREEDQIKFINNLIALADIEGFDFSSSQTGPIGKILRFINNLITWAGIEGFDFSSSQTGPIDKKFSNNDFVMNYLKQKINDLENSFKLRKLALFTLMEFWHEFSYEQNLTSLFLNSLDRFSKEEQDPLLGEMSNWKNSSSNWRRESIKILSTNILSDFDEMKFVFESNLKIILDMNVLIFYEDIYSHITALMYAVINGNKEQILYLIEKGADINAGNRNDITPLMYAVINENNELVQFLIEKGADINAKDENNMTALMYAAENGEKKIVQLLIKEDDVDVNTKSHNGKTALMYAVMNGNKKSAQLLIEEGAEMEVRDTDDMTVLIYAVRKGDNALVQLLIEEGADVNTGNRNDITPLMYALLMKNDKVAQILIKEGADVNAENRDGETVLIYAERWRNDRMVNLLIEEGADVNAKDK